MFQQLVKLLVMLFIIYDIRILGILKSLIFNFYTFNIMLNFSWLSYFKFDSVNSIIIKENLVLSYY